MSTIHRHGEMFNLVVLYLPKAKEPSMNDTNLVSLFVAFRERHCTSLDNVLADPDLRNPFVETARLAMGPIPEKDILKRLIYLRKKRSLPPANRRRRSSYHASTQAARYKPRRVRHENISGGRT